MVAIVTKGTWEMASIACVSKQFDIEDILHVIDVRLKCILQMVDSILILF